MPPRLRLERTHVTLQEEVRRLTDELEAKNRELARKNRLADLGQMAAHVAHEVRNTLVPVSLYLSLLRRRLLEDDQSLDVLRKIESGFQALDVTVNDLLHFTSDRDPHCEPFRGGRPVLRNLRFPSTRSWRRRRSRSAERRRLRSRRRPIAR